MLLILQLPRYLLSDFWDFQSLERQRARGSTAVTIHAALLVSHPLSSHIAVTHADRQAVVQFLQVHTLACFNRRGCR
jgi:hypothetical protein